MSLDVYLQKKAAKSLMTDTPKPNCSVGCISSAASQPSIVSLSPEVSVSPLNAYSDESGPLIPILNDHLFRRKKATARSEATLEVLF